MDSHDCFMMDKAQIIYGVEAQHPNMETPYTFVSCVENEDGESYQLPKISFGICEKTCFIYAIQDGENHQRQDSFYKRVKRALYRANKEVEDDYFDEKITDVSPAQVCSLALFLGYMNRKGIQQFEACSYLPMRYQAKDLILLGKQKKMEALLMNLEEPIKVKMLDEMEEAFSYADHLQENITNKFIRNFLRLQYHFKEIEITSYPGESDSALHYQTPQTLMEYDDSLITELYQKTNTPPHQAKSI